MASSIGGEIFRRRIPQVVGIYLAAGWAVLEFTDWLVNRYVLSPHLIDFALLAWGLMLPTVLMLAWFHGAPGRDRWGRFEKYGIPANIAVAGLVLLAVFGGKDLGAATTSVTIQDTETGETVERTIPKSEFRKSLTVYFFDNVSGDTELDWLQYGLVWALETDLEQDLFIDVRDSDLSLRRLKEEGNDAGLSVPIGLKREIAEVLNLDNFITGTITEDSGEIVIATSLYETRRGRVVSERTFRGDDLFAIVDEMTVQIKRDLELPDQHIEEVKDLPISEIATSSLSAYRSHVYAYYHATVRADLAEGLAHVTDAVATDPQFAMAHMLRFSLQLALNDIENGKQSLEEAMRLLYKLPERSQFEIKVVYYWLIRQDSDKALVAAGMYAELYPQDIAAHQMLAEFYGMKGDKERAIAAFERILELDPGRADALTGIGQLQESMGDFAAARDYYEQYASEVPSDPQAFITLGNLERLLGDPHAAGRQYEKALIIDPNNVSALVRVASLEGDLGNFEQALEGYDEALAVSVTPEQRSWVYQALQSYHELRGQPSAAVESMHRRWLEMEKYQAPFNLLQEKLQSLHIYVAAGQTSAARDSLSSFANQLSPPFDVLVALGELDIYMELEDADSIEATIPGLERFIEAFGLEEARSLIVYAQGRVLELRGDCQEAIVSYTRALQLSPRSAGYNTDIGRCHRELGQLSEAETHLTRALRVYPTNPESNYELALVYSEMGDREKALEYLRIALEVWAEAEPVFEPAQEARDKLLELVGAA